MTGIAAIDVSLLWYITLWYISNGIFSIANKQVLRISDCLITTCAQLATGSALAALSSVKKRRMEWPKSRHGVFAAVACGALHFLGNYCTNYAMQWMSLPFVHTIKSTEPLFALIIGLSLFRKNAPSVTLGLIASISLLISGTVLASLKEQSFSLDGFLNAICSNVSFQLRNFMVKSSFPDTSPDTVMLWTSVWGLGFSAVALSGIIALGGDPGFASASLPLSTNIWSIWKLILIMSCMHFAYNALSFRVLQRVSPLTHSILNCMKRMVVICLSILVFRTSHSPLNIVGMLIAVSSSASYSFEIRRLQSHSLVVNANTSPVKVQLRDIERT
jgi:solute carrier family 35, member E1